MLSVNTLFVGQNAFFLNEVDSTNTYAANLIKQNNPPEGSIIYSYNQQKGRGQRGNSWYSEPNSNVAFSVILHPSFLEPSRQFYLSKIISLAACDLMADILKGVTIRIKWPNDIYINNQKIAGILIENNITSEAIKNSIVGIGINVNQVIFPENINATSLTLLSDNSYALDSVVEKLCKFIEARYLQLKAGNVKLIDEQYLHQLYQFGEIKNYSSPEKTFRGRIVGVSASGKLQLEINSGEVQEFDLKEISFL